MDPAVLRYHKIPHSSLVEWCNALLRPLALFVIGCLLLAIGLYASAQGDTIVVALYVVAGAFGMAALLEKLWKE
jgi:uncharacterized membrane protein YdbT with pleckstrin-like domain